MGLSTHLDFYLPEVGENKFLSLLVLFLLLLLWWYWGFELS
jgi:hypothetical protein